MNTESQGIFRFVSCLSWSLQNQELHEEAREQQQGGNYGEVLLKEKYLERLRYSKPVVTWTPCYHRKQSIQKNARRAQTPTVQSTCHTWKKSCSAGTTQHCFWLQYSQRKRMAKRITSVSLNRGRNTIGFKIDRVTKNTSQYVTQASFCLALTISNIHKILHLQEDAKMNTSKRKKHSKKISPGLWVRV